MKKVGENIFYIILLSILFLSFVIQPVWSLNVTSVNITPNRLLTTTDAAGMWNYSEATRYLENGSVWTWFVNGTEAWRDSSLVGYWRLDGNYSNSGGSGNNGGQDLAVSQPTNISGMIKTAAFFDGDNDNISFGHITALDGASAAYTISLWVNCLACVASNTIFAYDGNGLLQTNDLYLYWSTAQGNVRYQVGNGQAELSSHITNINDAKWHHIAAVKTATTFTLYEDGAQTDSVSRTGAAFSNYNFIVGGNHNINFWNGSMDEIRIYNRSLSATEIANLYNMMDYGQLDKAFDSGGSPAPDKPISLWHFNEMGESIVTDAFGKNPCNGTLGYTLTGQYGTSGGFFTLGNQSIGNNGLRNLSIGGNITLETWINPNGYNNGHIISVGLANTSDYELFLSANGSATFRIHNSSTSLSVYSRLVANGTLTHIVGTYNGTDLLIYRNGTLEGRLLAYGQINTGTSRILRIGANVSDSLFYNGTIDELAVYDRSLSIDEINQSFLRNFPLFGLDTTMYNQGSNVSFSIEPSNGTSFGATSSSVTRNVVEGSEPTWSSNVTNFTRIGRGQVGIFNATWTDNVQLSGFIFSIGDLGTFVNSTFQRFSGTINVSTNATIITAEPGTVVSWRFYTNDTSNNWNVTPVFTFVVNRPPKGSVPDIRREFPTHTIDVGPLFADGDGDTLTINITTTAGISVSIVGTKVTFSAATDTSGIITFTVTDGIETLVTRTSLSAIQSVPLSGGGGGSARVAASKGESLSAVALTGRYWSSAPAGAVLSMSVHDKAHAVSGITLHLQNKVSNMGVSLKSYNTQIPNALPFSGVAYQYAEIETKNIKESDLRGIDIAFTVAESWLAKNKLDPHGVALYHYVAKSWQKLPTVYSDNSYQAKSPSLSYFVIGSENVLEKTKTNKQHSDTKETGAEPDDSKEHIQQKEITKADDIPLETQSESMQDERKTSSGWVILLIIFLCYIIFMSQTKFPKKAKFK